MHIQPPVNVGPGTGAQGVGFPSTSGGTSPGAAAGMRADWVLHVNLQHSRGFIGGAGRLLIANEKAEDRTQVTFFLPAQVSHNPGSMRLLSAVVCSAKPGTPAQAGQPLIMQALGHRAVVTIPLLKLNDWIFIDLTWDGAFPVNGAAWPGGAVPLGLYHPQVAVDVAQPNGSSSLAPIKARYEVTLGTEVGARVRLDGEGSVNSRVNDETGTAEHEFRSFGAAAIQASVTPPGAV